MQPAGPDEFRGQAHDSRDRLHHIHDLIRVDIGRRSIPAQSRLGTGPDRTIRMVGDYSIVFTAIRESSGVAPVLL